MITESMVNNKMNDLISRQKVLRLIRMVMTEETVSSALLYQSVSQMDSEETEHKVGKWIVLDIRDYAQRYTGRKVGKCPFCGYLTGEFRRLLESHHELTNFCPNCGAKMEE